MAKGATTTGLATETLRRISPCEHGIEHSLLSVAEGVSEFAVPECTDSKGALKAHRITDAKYPDKERKR